MKWPVLLIVSCTACGVGSVSLSDKPLDLGASSVSSERAAAVVADGNDQITLTITVLTSGGLPVRDQDVLITITGSDNTLTVPRATDANGVTTVVLSSTRAETKVISAAVISHGVRVELPNPAVVHFVAAAPAGLRFTAQPMTTTAASTLAPAVQVGVVDAHDNFTDASGIPVTLSLTGNPAGGLSGDLTQPSDHGLATFAAVQVSKSATYTLSASAPGLAAAISNPFTVKTGPAIALAFAALPSGAVVGQTLAPAVVVRFTDAGGNWVRTAGGLVILSLLADNTGALLSGTLQVNATGGAASFADLLLDKAGQFSLQATAAGYQPAVSTTFTVATASPSMANSSLLVTPGQGVADSNSSIKVTFTVRDVNNNPVASQAVLLSSSEPNDVLMPRSGVTDSAGQFVSNWTARKASTRTLTGHVAGSQITLPVTFVAGAPSANTSTLTASPNQISAGGSAASLSLQLMDINGNAISGRSVSLSSTGTGNVISPSGGITDANGRFASTLFSTVAEDKVISANLPTRAPAVVHVTPGTLDTSKCTLAGSPNTVTADGNTAMQVLFTATDSYGNGIAGQSVALTVSGSNNSLNPNQGFTDDDGTFRATLTSTRAQTKQLTAVMGSHTYNTAVSFVPGPASAGTSSLIASQTSLTADGSASTTLTVTALDAQSNPLVGAPVSLSSTGSQNTFSATNLNTDAGGQTSATLRSTKAEVKQVRAAVGGLALNTNITFQPGPPLPGRCVLMAYPSAAVLADGWTPANLALQLLDAQGNVVPQQAVTWSTPGAGFAFSNSTGVTHANGVTMTQFVSTLAGSRVVTASYGPGLSSTATVNFVTTPACSGTPMLPSTPWPSTHTDTVALAAGDFNEDGQLDLVAAWRSDNQLGLFLQHAHGLFLAPTAVAVGTAPSAVLVQDFDNDTHLDLFVANGGDATVAVLRGLGNGTFAAPQTYAVGGVAAQLVGADFNGDTRVDVAAVVNDANSVAVLLNTGVGTLAAPVYTSVGRRPTALAKADFNADNRIDLVVTNADDQTVSVLLGQNNGSFALQAAAAVSSAPGPLVAGDFNGDAKADWAVANTAADTVTLALGLGNGTFSVPVALTVAADVQALAAVDVNGDNSVDLLGASYVNSSAAVLLNRGDGTFRVAPGITTAVGSAAVVAADIDGDGHMDAAVLNTISRNISVGWGAGNGNFAMLPTVATGAAVQLVRLADINEDSKMDAIILSPEDGMAGVLLGNNDGTFQTPHLFAVGGTPAAVDWGDYNTDGHLDLVVALAGDGNLTVWLGQGNGTFIAGTVVAAGNGPHDVVATDLNGDGYADLVSVQQGDSTVQVNLGDGNGQFAAAVRYAVAPGPIAVITTRLNADAHPDVVTVNHGDDSISVLLGVGDGTLQAATRVAVGSRPSAAVARDFNSDAAMDVWVANTNGNSVTLLPGHNDGTFGAASSVSVALSPVAVASGDVDGDGKLDGLVLLEDSGTVAVLFGQGDGTFATPFQYPGPRGVVAGFAVGDVNSDGRVDVLAPQSASRTLAILLGGTCVP